MTSPEVIFTVCRRTTASSYHILMGPLQLGSRDHNFPKNLLYYGLQLKECQKWKEHIENTKMAKFEVLSIKE